MCVCVLILLRYIHCLELGQTETFFEPQILLALGDVFSLSMFLKSYYKKWWVMTDGVLPDLERG